MPDVLDMLHIEGGSDRGSLTDSGKGASEEGDHSRPSPIDPQLLSPDRGKDSHRIESDND